MKFKKEGVINNSQLKIMLFIVFTSLFFTSCSHIFYAANDAHTLGLEEQGDVKVNISTFSESDSNADGLAFKTGYSPIEHIGVQLSYANLKAEEETGYILNTGVGYYHTLFEKKEQSKDTWINENTFTSKILFDAYAGFAFGQSYNNYQENTEVGSLKLKMNQYYMQTGLHFSFWSLCKLSFSYRLSLLDFTKATIKGEFTEEGFSDLDTVVDNNPFLLNEFSSKLIFGFKPFSLFFTTTAVNSNKFFPIGTSSFQFGIASDINTLFSKKVGD